MSIPDLNHSAIYHFKIIPAQCGLKCDVTWQIFFYFFFVVVRRSSQRKKEEGEGFIVGRKYIKFAVADTC